MAMFKQQHVFYISFACCTSWSAWSVYRESTVLRVRPCLVLLTLTLTSTLSTFRTDLQAQYSISFSTLNLRQSFFPLPHW